MEQLCALAALLLIPSLETSGEKGFVAAFLAAVFMHGPFSAEEFVQALLQSPGSLGAIIQLLKSGQEASPNQRPDVIRIRDGDNSDSDSPTPRSRRALTILVRCT